MRFNRQFFFNTRGLPIEEIVVRIAVNLSGVAWVFFLVRQFTERSEAKKC
jgi:hypothetical protein